MNQVLIEIFGKDVSGIINQYVNWNNKQEHQTKYKKVMYELRIATYQLHHKIDIFTPANNYVYNSYLNINFRVWTMLLRNKWMIRP